MANAYPSPCLKCETADTCGHGCEHWKMRYRYRQKQINAYAKKVMHGKTKGPTLFVYEHPDVIRRYLESGPCDKCRADAVCDTPCPAYLRWWDARMQILRRRYTNE